MTSYGIEFQTGRFDWACSETEIGVPFRFPSREEARAYARNRVPLPWRVVAYDHDANSSFDVAFDNNYGHLERRE